MFNRYCPKLFSLSFLPGEPSRPQPNSVLLLQLLLVQELKFPCFVAAVQFSQLMSLTWCLCTHNDDTDTKMYRKRRDFSA